MRRYLALGCCAAQLAFGIVAAAAHVHGSTDHHEVATRLHLDHVHFGEAAAHGPAVDDDDETHLEGRHGHHDGDALYVSALARRSPDPGLRVLPALVSAGVTVDPPAPVLVRHDVLPNPLRGPPATGPTRSRAPPA